MKSCSVLILPQPKDWIRTAWEWSDSAENGQMITSSNHAFSTTKWMSLIEIDLPIYSNYYLEQPMPLLDPILSSLCPKQPLFVMDPAFLVPGLSFRMLGWSLMKRMPLARVSRRRSRSSRILARMFSNLRSLSPDARKSDSSSPSKDRRDCKKINIQNKIQSCHRFVLS